MMQLEIQNLQLAQLKDGIWCSTGKGGALEWLLRHHPKPKILRVQVKMRVEEMLQSSQCY